jgi:hypothetical protein
MTIVTRLMLRQRLCQGSFVYVNNFFLSSPRAGGGNMGQHSGDFRQHGDRYKRNIN